MPTFTFLQFRSAIGSHARGGDDPLLERRGLIPQPTQKWVYRRYDTAHVARIRFIKRAQDLGFPLEEIESLLRLQDGVNRTQIQQIASARLTQIRERIEDLQRTEVTLSHLLRHCRTSAEPKCPI